MMCNGQRDLNTLLGSCSLGTYLYMIGHLAKASPSTTFQLNSMSAVRDSYGRIGASEQES